MIPVCSYNREYINIIVVLLNIFFVTHDTCFQDSLMNKVQKQHLFKCGNIL